MIETSTDDPILLLHSSCMGGDEAIVSSQRDFTMSNGTGNDLAGSGLLKEPIFCDLLLLPEHPSSSFSHHNYLHLPTNAINPCGISNILTLENFPKHWLAGPVLLSLSSCSIFYRNGSDGDDGFTTSIPLPVEPIPSTFVLDFYSNQDLGNNDEAGERENEQYNSTIISRKTMSEISVALDVREASRQAKEALLRQENLTMINRAEDRRESRSEDDSKNHPDDYQRFKDRLDSSREASYLQDEGTETKGEEENPFYHHGRPRLLEDISHSLDFNDSFASKDFTEQKLLLTHLKAQLEQGTQTVNLVLFICGFFCIFSMLILLWTIYQYYRTTFKSDLFSQEIRESMKATHDMLQITVDELNHYDNRTTKRHQPLNILDETILECETESTVTTTAGKYGAEEDQNNSTPRGTFMTLSRASKRNSSNNFRQGNCSTYNKNDETENLFPPIVSDDIIDIHRQRFSLKGEKKCKGDNKNDLVSPTQDNTTRRVRHNQDVVISLVGRGKEEPEDKKPYLITPTWDNNGADTCSQGISPEFTIANVCKEEGKSLDGIMEHEMEPKNSLEKTSAPVKLPGVPTSPQQEGEKKLFHVRSLSSRHGNYFLAPLVKKSPSSNSVKEWIEGKILEKNNKVIETPFSPCSRLANELNDGVIPLQSQTTMSSIPLSPCSQLAKEWNEGKTVRRGNLKKRRQYLTPLLQSNDITCHDDGGKNLFESTILSRMSKTSNLHSRYYQQQELSCNILPPPKLRSVARNNNMVGDAAIESLLADQVTRDDKEDTERNIMDGMKTPPLNIIAQKAPFLCYTPASEDHSFVDDYW